MRIRVLQIHCYAICGATAVPQMLLLPQNYRCEQCPAQSHSLQWERAAVQETG